MADDKADPNQIKYKGELVNGQLILTSVEYPPQFVGEDGQVIATCEPVEVVPQNAITFDEERRPPEIALEHTVQHTTIGGKGVVGRLRKP